MSTQLFNFLSHQVTTGPYSDQKFGLIDPEEGIAQVDLVTPQNWLATVTNNKQLYKNKSAYLSNKQKPYFPFSLKDDMAQFYKTHGFKLLIQAEITINK